MNKPDVIKGKTWQAQKFDGGYIVNINNGEKIISSLEDFILSEKIGSAEITGIGATNEATLGFFNFKKEEFSEQTFSEQMEIASAIGNASYKNEELYIHMHVTLVRDNYSSYAGHLVEATIHGVAEFYVRTNPFKVYKSNEVDKNMWVYNFEKTEI